MASITIRKLEDTVKTRLRVRAARNGRSMEEEARAILKGAVAGDATAPVNLAQAIRRHVLPVGGVDLIIAKRQPMRRPPKLDK